MKLSELKPCALCDGKLVPLWYVVRFSMAMVKPTAANQVLGLTQYFGGNIAVAEAMAPDTDCVAIFGDQEPKLMTELHICQECFMHQLSSLLIAAEKSRGKEEEENHAHEEESQIRQRPIRHHHRDHRAASDSRRDGGYAPHQTDR